MTLIVDRGLDPLPEAIAGTCEQVSRIRNAGEFALLLQPYWPHSFRGVRPLAAMTVHVLSYVSRWGGSPARASLTGRVGRDIRVLCVPFFYCRN